MAADQRKRGQIFQSVQTFRSWTYRRSHDFHTRAYPRIFCSNNIGSIIQSDTVIGQLLQCLFPRQLLYRRRRGTDMESHIITAATWQFQHIHAIAEDRKRSRRFGFLQPRLSEPSGVFRRNSGRLYPAVRIAKRIRKLSHWHRPWMELRSKPWSVSHSTKISEISQTQRIEKGHACNMTLLYSLCILFIPCRYFRLCTDSAGANQIWQATLPFL